MRSKNNRYSDKSGKRDDLLLFLRHCGIGFLVFGVVTVAFAALYSTFNLPQLLIMPLTAVAACMGTFAAGYTAAKNKRENGMFVGLLCALFIFAVMAVCNMLFVGEGFGFLSLLKLGLTLLSGAVGGVFGVNTRIKR